MTTLSKEITSWVRLILPSPQAPSPLHGGENELREGNILQLEALPISLIDLPGRLAHARR
ncbi:hypothetical protein POPTR_014G022950v4 [Populus trichocarpa]|uniref:Uncharacterized protein n=1 Tax=Populus trichocarpa TaxID=3694 RepID=A0ACC0RWW5_POPTR|nr:hypothetical protein POPTR_014G022950v4 [Populus trichocarpa]